ncbi:Translocating chain-associated membrane protein 1-like 1 [Geodia barretti]|uniref:Translocating chain-associated membrane protein 1-like 1 n=1 Tax=Geodia barretti TaxID=519541 RepID=A0AA35XGS6_GEOBA|nr:Translocating chain-associated membrane protein 1-like 1 [Geodia barretti]
MPLCRNTFGSETVKCLNKHLPPTETSTYYDSGCLAVFYLVFVIWGLGIFLTNGDPTLATTDLYTEHWLEYQSKIFMSPFLKLFMLTQMGFWVHCYVWLTFMEENKTFSNIVLYTLSLVIIAVNYIIRMQHAMLVMLVFHYSMEFLYHFSRIMLFHGQSRLSSLAFNVCLPLQIIGICVKALSSGELLLPDWSGALPRTWLWIALTLFCLHQKIITCIVASRTKVLYIN